MEARSRFAAAGAIALVAGIAALWFATGHDGDEGAPAPRIEPPPVESPAPAGTVTAMTEGATAAAQPVAADAPAPGPQRSEVPVAATKNATLRGRCVDADGEPLADCKVDLTAWAGNTDRMDKWLTDHGEKPEWKDPPDVVTGTDGTFGFVFWPPPPFQFALHVTLDGCGAMSGRWGTLAEGSATDVGDVVMTAGVRVTGRVVDASGVPQAKQQVTVSRRQRGGFESGRVGPRWNDQGTSKADGTFATHGWLPPGEYEVRTQKLELQSPKTLTLSAERPTEDITVVVAKPPATETITGRVLDETGAPASGVDIEDRSERGGWSRTTSRRDGTFELRQRQPGEDQTALLSVVAGTFDVEEKGPRKVEWGATDVEFRVVRAGVLTLRVTDPQQAPVETYTVRLIPRNRGRWSSADSRARAQGKHEDGTVVVAGLTRGDWLLLVDFPAATGFEPLFAKFSHEGGPRRMDLCVQPCATRTVRVVAGDDAPVAGTVVQLCELFDAPLDDTRLVMQRDNWLMNSGNQHALVLGEGTTGADGRVELRGPAARDLGVCVLGPGHVPLRQSGVRLDSTDELVVRVSRGARLAGRIVPPEALAELKRLAGGDASFPTASRPRLSFSDGKGRTFPRDHLTASNHSGLRIADDGSFAVEGVPPGLWQVQVHGTIANEGGGGTSHPLPAGEVTMVDGRTTTQDLDLTYVVPGTVEGTVVLNGQPLANENVSLTGGRTSVGARTDSEGRFRKSMFPGDYTLVVERQRKNRGYSQLTCATRVHVVRDQTTTMMFAIASTTLKVTVLDPDGKPVAMVGLHALGSDKDGSYLPPTDDAGVTEAELTTGTVTLRILPKALTTPEAQQKLWMEAQARGDTDPLGPHWIALQTVALDSGRTSAIELRLPASAGY